LFHFAGRAKTAFVLPLIQLIALAIAAGQSDELAAKSQRAKEMMEAARFEEAIPIYKQLVLAVPGNAGLLLNLALAQHMAGRDREAIPNLESVLKVQPGALPALIALGAARLSTNQPQLAVGPLQKAVAADPRNQDAVGLLASALVELKRFGQAAEVYRKLTDLAPDDSRAWYGLGTTYESIAASAFERLEKAAPQSPYLTVLIADTRVQRRQFGSADSFYHEALRQLTGIHGIHSALADLYRKTGHQDWAAMEDAKEQGLPAPDCGAHPSECEFLAGHDVQASVLPRESAPTPEALFWQAKAANELALQAFFRLGQLPPSVELHQLRADIARDQKQPLEAVKEWREALALSPGNPRVMRELAVSLFLAQEYRAAIEEAGAILKSNPRSPELNFVTGDSFLRLEEPEKAVPYLRAALAADPKLLAAEASLGLALSRLGQQKEAVPHLEKALALDDDGSLHYQLARAYQSAGASDKARTTMAQYQEILKKVAQQKEEAARQAQIGPPK
jgi:tetratricopeptide (TPR) repeat protein